MADESTKRDVIYEKPMKADEQSQGKLVSQA